MTTNGIKHQAKLAMWKENIANCRSSGICVSKWCEEHHICKSTYYRWERELVEQIESHPEALPAQAPAPAFAELPTPVPKAKASTEADAKLAARIQIGSVAVELYEGASVELAAAVCQAVSHAE